MNNSNKAYAARVWMFCIIVFTYLQWLKRDDGGFNPHLLIWAWIIGIGWMLLSSRR